MRQDKNWDKTPHSHHRRDDIGRNYTTPLCQQRYVSTVVFSHTPVVSSYAAQHGGLISVCWCRTAEPHITHHTISSPYRINEMRQQHTAVHCISDAVRYAPVRLIGGMVCLVCIRFVLCCLIFMSCHTHLLLPRRCHTLLSLSGVVLSHLISFLM